MRDQDLEHLGGFGELVELEMDREQQAQPLFFGLGAPFDCRLCGCQRLAELAQRHVGMCEQQVRARRRVLGKLQPGLECTDGFFVALGCEIQLTQVVAQVEFRRQRQCPGRDCGLEGLERALVVVAFRVDVTEELLHQGRLVLVALIRGFELAELLFGAFVIVFRHRLLRAHQELSFGLPNGLDLARGRRLALGLLLSLGVRNTGTKAQVELGRDRERACQGRAEQPREEPSGHAPRNPMSVAAVTASHRLSPRS